MDICTITCNNAVNYGARLQTFALQQYLKSLGHDVRVIDYEPHYMSFKTRLWYNPGFDLKEWGRLVLQARQRCLSIRKHAALHRFSAINLTLTRKYHTVEELRDDPPKADIYIAGSDQIWNVTFENGKDPAFYLDFGPKDTKRLSYAASIAVPELPDKFHNFVNEKLSRFDAISVREESAQHIVGDLGHQSAVVCDPVFLLSKDFWSDFADCEGVESSNRSANTGQSERYLLVYDFESNARLKDVALTLARAKGLPIYSVSPRPLSYARRNYCDCTPQTFVSLMKNADTIVCNSFHGCVYAMIFGKDFFVVNRADGLNCRMSELLVRYGLSDRVVTPDTISCVYEYPKLDNTKLQADIIASKSWLERHLETRHTTIY